MPTVADYIEQHSSRLVERYIDEVARLPSARGVTRNELLDTFQEYLATLATISRQGHRGDTDQTKARLEETHLSLRLRLGYTLAEVEQEYVLMGRIISHLWEGLPSELQPTPADIQLLFDELHEAMGHASATFSGYSVEDRQREKHFLRRLDALAPETLGTEDDPDLVRGRLEPLLEVIQEALEADGCALYLTQEDGSQLRLVASVGRGAEPPFGSEAEPGGPTFVGKVAVSDEPLQLSDASNPAVGVREAVRTSALRSLLGVRLWPMGKLAGVLTVGVLRSQPFEPRIRRYAETLAEYLAGIIERAQLLERIRTVESRYRLATQALTEAVWDWNLRTGRLEWSEGIYKLLGHRPESLGQDISSWTDNIHPEDRPRVEQDIQATIEEGRTHWRDEYRFRVGSGGYVTVLDVGVVERDPSGQAVRMVGAMQDVTEQRRAEAALRESEARYRTLFDSIDEGFCIIEMIFDSHGHPLDYRFLEANPAFVRQTGLEDAVGRRMRELAPTHEEHWFEIYGRIARTGIPERFEQRAAALGHYYDVFAFRMGEAHENKVAILFNDVLNRKQTEQELRERADFEQQLVGIVSHDLRQPLQGIGISAALLLRRKDLGEPVRNAANRILTASDRMGRMLRDLLDLTQARLGGGIPLERAPTDLGVLAERVADDLRLIHPGRDIEVTVHANSEGAWDGDRLTQVLTNLVANAIAYSPEDSPVTLEVQGEVGDVVIRVRNAGEPIAPDVLSRLFKPLSRGATSKENPDRSVGLGLFIVKHIVQAHGGSVDVHSAQGEGTVFTVRLPRA